VIDTEETLHEWLPKIRKASWIALDTEADSLHAYPEKLCLLQIGLPDGELLVDPLSDIPLDRLWQSLQGHELILHGADYDLRLLHKTGGFVPAKIFDTMLAARLAGCRQFGLTDLVFQFLGARLEKGPQKANWARRPLTQRMEAYALNDVRFLHRLCQFLRDQLEAKGRLDWHEEWCARLISECTVPRQNDPDKVWRVKGSHQLAPAALAVLREIWHWRESEAVRSNKPPYFIMAPTTMVDIAAASLNGGSLRSVMPPRLSTRRQAGVRDAVAKGLATSSHPQRPRRSGRRPTDAEKVRYHNLEKRRDEQAARLEIDATLIASRATLMALARDWSEASEELMRWQADLLQS